MENKKNYNSINIMKFICAIMVVHIHIVSFLNFNNNFENNLNEIFKFITLAIVPVGFFMITSSWLFFTKINSSENDKVYFKSYIKRLVILYLLWSILYIPFTIKELNSSNIIKDIFIVTRKILLTGTYGHLWYITTLFYSLIIVFYLRKYLSVNKLFILSVIVYLLGLMGDSYYHILDSLPALQNIINSYLKIFADTRLSMGIICVVIGLYISENYDKIKSKKIILLYILAVICLYMETKIVSNFSFGLTNERYIFKIIVATLIFLIVLRIPIKQNKVNLYLRYCSTIMYFSHFLFIKIYEIIIPSGELRNGFITFFLVVISTMILSLIMYKLSKKEQFRWVKYFY